MKLGKVFVNQGYPVDDTEGLPSVQVRCGDLGEVAVEYRVEDVFDDGQAVVIYLGPGVETSHIRVVDGFGHTHELKETVGEVAFCSGCCRNVVQVR